MKHDLYNIGLDITDHSGVLDDCNRYLHSDRPHTIFFLNAHCFNIAQKDHDYRKAINESDLLLNDGIGISIACRLGGLKPIENLNGTDLIPRIMAYAAKKGISVYLLGGKNGVAENAAESIRYEIPEINIAGTASGYFNGYRENEIIKDINDSKAGLLVLGMGVPKQELWAGNNRRLLKNVRIIIAGGAILDFISGRVKRAPVWMRKIRLEWVYRLCIEPGRLWRRYITGNLLFFWHLAKLKSLSIRNHGHIPQAEDMQRLEANTLNRVNNKS